MTGSNTPKVSVCIPAFNAAEFLRQAVESVLEQSYLDVEIVIIDNCSTDETIVVVEELIKKSIRNIRFYKNDRNIGLVGNLNRCLEYAQGTYIKLLMADDVLLPGCLKQMANALDTHRPVTLVASGRLIIDERGRELTIRRYSNTNALVPGKKAITECLFGSNYSGEPTAVMFRKSDLKGKFREDLPQVLDIDMWFRLLEGGDLLYIGEPLCAIRRHSDQMTHANIQSGALVEDNIELFEAYSHKAYIRPSLRLAAQHKIYMAHRVWMSRKYISSEKKKMLLNRYGSTLAYWLMPVGLFLLNFKMRAFASLKRLFQPESSARCK